MVDSIRNQFGRILREARLAQGLTQEELAFQAGMNVTYLSDLERGLWNPSLAMLVDLARALKSHPADLVRGIDIAGENDVPKRKRPVD